MPKKKNKKKEISSHTHDQPSTPEQRAMWHTFEKMQEQVNQSFSKLKKDLKNKADIHTINQDKNELLLLLGECNYMESECLRNFKGAKKRKGKR